MQHKHHDLIVAWAKGAKIQLKTMGVDGNWQDQSNPSWNEVCDYRIKPEPKPDVVLYGMVALDSAHPYARIQHVGANGAQRKTDTCMFIFDGETGKLKDAQVLVNSGLAV